MINQQRGDQYDQQPEYRSHQSGVLPQSAPHARTSTVLLPLLGILVTLVLAACGSGNTSSPPSGGSQTTPAPSSPAAPAERDTAAGAQAAASTVFELYGGGEYAAVWQDLVPSAQAAVPESTYLAVHEQCQMSGRSYQVSNPVLASPTSAVVTVSLTGVASSLGSEPMDFSYVSGKWLWAPSAQLLAPYKAGSVSAIVAAEKATGVCS